MPDPTQSLLPLLLITGSLFLAADFARHRSPWFAALLALLALERLAGLLPVQPDLLHAGLFAAGATLGLRVALALVLARLVVGRLLFLLARRYRPELAGDAA